MPDELDNDNGSSPDFESGVSAIQDLIPDMGEADIRRAIEQMARSENVDPGTCAQLVRAELEAGRLPVEQFKAHSASY
ncbi:hypothetical protein GN316_18865 [Xylophilus sp. Kf1]|nr:hypothetical protein [Xylophilus sp. Kf1]